MKNVHFREQHPIGDYFPDFCAPRKKLIIELDGSQLGYAIIQAESLAVAVKMAQSSRFCWGMLQFQFSKPSRSDKPFK
jgi:very-short-patch-repair endonuclease